MDDGVQCSKSIAARPRHPQPHHRLRTTKAKVKVKKQQLCGGSSGGGLSFLHWPILRMVLAAAVSLGITVTTTAVSQSSPTRATGTRVQRTPIRLGTSERRTSASRQELSPLGGRGRRCGGGGLPAALLARKGPRRPKNSHNVNKGNNLASAPAGFLAPYGTTTTAIARRERARKNTAWYDGAGGIARLTVFFKRPRNGGGHGAGGTSIKSNDGGVSRAVLCRALPKGEHGEDSGWQECRIGGGGGIRQRSRKGGGSGGGRSMYTREGIFQALPFPVRITVMGGGNFGLALSLVLARNQIPTTLLVRTQGVAEHVNSHREHPQYLKGIKIPPCVHATADPKEALKDATYMIHAVPVQYTRKFLEKVVPHMPPGAPILSVSKGIETSSLMLMNDILKETCGAGRSYAFLSGPSFAREIAMNQATAVVIASDDSSLANDFAEVLSSPSFRCFTSRDVVGVEVGGAVKNVIALAAGMCEGLGLGTNAMAGLVTRGCGEMRRMAVTLGGNPRTLSGLSGVGDTFGTCFGPLSRNRNFGIRLGKGESMEEILASSTEVAEGVDTALALADLIKKVDRSYRVDLKYAIIFGVADILKGERSPKEGLEDLMTMPLRAEMYHR